MPAPTVESHANSTPSGGTTATIAVNAAGSGRVIIVCAAIGSTTSAVPTATISSANPNIGPWTAVAATSGVNNGSNGAGAGCLIQAWYAVTTGSVSGATVTITSSTTIDNAGLVYLTVAGAAGAQPLDQNASLAHGGGLGSSATAWFTTGPAPGTFPMSCAVGTNTANVRALTIMGSNVSVTGAGSLQSGTTVVDSARNGGGTLWAYLDVYTASFSTPQSATQVGSVSVNLQSVWGTFGLGVTADAQAGGAVAQARAMVLA